MFRLTPVTIAVLTSFYAISASAAIANNALPTGGQVTQGQAVIQQPTQNQLQINQNSQKAVINWNTFNIGKQAGVQFNQPNAQSSTLNRVANGSSEIAGQLKANGQIFLLNPNGILFSPTAQVNTGSLIAATASMTDADYLNGNGTLQNSANGSIVNQGNLTAAQGGQIILASQHIDNAGNITAQQGHVSLLGGQSTRVNITADGLIAAELETGAANARINNSGNISATGGRIDVLAKGDNSQITHTGLIEAQSIVEKDGKIYLIAGYEGEGVAPKTGTAVIDGALDASAPNGGNGGFVETSAGKVSITNNTQVTTKASNGNNGTWLIDPQDFTIAVTGGDISGATLGSNLNSGNVTILSSSGATAGEGNIFINDEVTYNANLLTLTASKDVVVNDAINVLGTGTLAVNTATANGADPADPSGVTRGETGNGYVFFQNAGDGLLTINGEAYRVIKSLGLEGSSTGNDLQGIQTGINYALGDDIDADATATWNGGQGFNPVNLDDQKFNGLGNEISNLTINRPTQDNVGLFGTATNADIQHLTLVNANVTGQNNVGSLVGDIVGSSKIMHSRAEANVQGQAVVGGLIGRAFGTDIANSLIDNSQATGSVTGIEDVGGLIGELTAFTVDNSSATGTASGEQRVGGLIGDANGWVEDSFATGNVTGTGGASISIGGFSGVNQTGSILRNVRAEGVVQGDQSVGGLVGENHGLVELSHAEIGSVTGSDKVGGLIGLNKGQVGNSHATGAVQGVEYSGGLVGVNEQGSITHSYATGNVTATGYAAGGLIGANSTSDLAAPTSGTDISVTGSYATGNVQGTLGVGGLIGANAANLATSTIEHVYATGNVAGTQYVGGLVGANAAQGGTSNINQTYATGVVSGTSDVGGLVGENRVLLGTSTVSNSYWNTQTTGQANAIGTNNGTVSNLTGLTSAQMQQLSSFANFGTEIDDQGGTGSVWRIYDGHTAPLLRHFLTPLTATVTAGGNKVYDATTNYTGGSFTLSDPAAVLLGTGVLSHLNKNVGVQNVRLTGLYSNQQGYDVRVVNSTVNVTPAPLMISSNAVIKTYDQTTNAAGSAIAVGGTQVFLTDTLTGGDFAFDNKNVGNNKSISVNNVIVNDGNGGNNYTVTYVDNTASQITPATLKVTANAADKVYDATTNSLVSLSDDRIAGDVLNISGSGNFADKNVGVDKVVTVNGITLTGADALNYALDPVAVTATADITPRVLNVSADAANKVYNGTTSATLSNITGNAIAGDTVIINATGAFVDKNAGTGKVVDIDAALAGADAANYTVNNINTTADITKALVYIDGVKHFDGTTNFNVDQLSARGITITTATGSVTEILGLSGNAIANGIGPSPEVITDISQKIYLTNLDNLSLTNSGTPTHAGEVAGLASNYYIMPTSTSPKFYSAYIYPASHLSTSHIPSIIKPVLPMSPPAISTQPTFDTPNLILNQNPLINRLDDCDNSTTQIKIAKECILKPKVVIQTSEQVADDDGTPATPIKAKRALIVANSAYSYPISALSGVANDSVKVAEILKSQGYQVSTVSDAKREDMIGALNQLIQDSESDDSVLIYYAGHGYVHEGSSMGHWIPVDAEVEDPKTWISNNDISRFIKNMAAKQILLVSDSCFSGSLSYEAALQREPKLPKNAVLKRRSVVVMTSGTEGQPVSDQGKDGLSPFASAFVQQLDGLQSGTELRAQTVYENVYQKVANTTKQQPTYGALPSAGHSSGGEYLFEK
jgi:filamentous hemagglutinin family protein